MSKYWSVCQVMPGIEHKVRADIEKGDRGAFLPTLAKVWVSDGKISSRECPMVPGYVFFHTEPEGWGDVQDIEGVQRVLTTDEGRAKRVSDSEMHRIVVDHASGQHNYVDRNISYAKPKEKKRQRKSRPGRRIRIRNATNRNRTDMGTSRELLHGPVPTALRVAQPPAG